MSFVMRLRTFLLYLTCFGSFIDAPPPVALPPGTASPTENGQLQPIALTPECKQVVALHCSKHMDSDWETLGCLQSDDAILQDVSVECQNTLWQRKYILTQKAVFEKDLPSNCIGEFREISECNSLVNSTFYVPCLIENKYMVKSPGCRAKLNQEAIFVFSDYRLIYHFVEACGEDIKSLGCGRIEIGPESPKEERDHLSVKSQGKTIHCLRTHIEKLRETCAKQVLRVAELQSDDYHLDLPLYYACREDRERLCPTVESGGGLIYVCLDNNKYNPLMSKECRSMITERQQLRALDYFVDFRLAKACAADLRKAGCGATDRSRSDATVSRMMLCLEAVEKPHFSVEANQMTKPGQLDAACKDEMLKLRQEMLDDYRLSPNLISHCQTTIERHCASKKHGRGTMLHCLAHLIRSYTSERPPIECEKAVYELVKLTNVEENVILDPVIDRACHNILSEKCAGLENAGHSALFECLSENQYHPSMTSSCRRHLLELLYFVTRDLTLDDHLHRACAEDSLKLCGFPKATLSEYNSADAQLLTCLYNHRRPVGTASPPSTPVLSEACNVQVMRIVHIRASAVSLDPRVFQVCLSDLSQCPEEDDSEEEDEDMEDSGDSDIRESTPSKHGEPLKTHRKGSTGLACLQERLDKLHPECRSAVVQVSAEAQQDASLDRLIMKACAAAASRFCSIVAGSEELLGCLVHHKNDPAMDPECREAVEHVQLVAQQDMQISRLHHYCLSDAQKYCKKEMFRGTAAVIVCLSELLTVREPPESKGAPQEVALPSPQTPVLSPACYKELVSQLYERSESINLDPELAQACVTDRKQFCSNVPPGAGRVIECLREHRTQLSLECHSKLFKRDELEALENRADYTLLKACQQMISVHCAPVLVRLQELGDELTEQTGHNALVECLTGAMTRENTRHGFDPICRKHLWDVLDLRSRDYRLDPVLQSVCRSDISKFCLAEARATLKSPYEQNGPVLHCLKRHFVEQKQTDQMLNARCYARVRLLLTWENAAHHLDPVLAGTCKTDILKNCPHKLQTRDKEDQEDMDDNVRECLLESLKKDKLQSAECRREVVLMIREAQSDLHIDPLLHEACAVEVQQICGEIEPGRGRQMACLLRVMNRPDAVDTLGPLCFKQLSKRMELWNYVAKYQQPDSLSDFIAQVNSSRSRNYILIALFLFFSCIFFMGLCCGRVTKRVPIDVKTK
ncbi:glycogenin glucosyltransferase glg1 [Clonorchis sinensis]|uniref:Glycogenin glucosyltransferase glg1 n=1 Tax=Clonorchis sinensis TaxID=79923 RepID=A0A8T1MGY2_CLOSI|nr:glycogenin glucosyltransferase glg1 [Clonorchis sinensis]